MPTLPQIHGMTVLNITRFIREDISLIKKLGHGKMGKIWSINPLFAVTHKTDFSSSIICFTAIINHAFKEFTIMSMH